ncbi:MAG: orotidine-5'-phosphate decarboxylase [Dehalococcoidales bacterium]|nr:orotidine-5'-phosphate decarboxylase [Dehalococcoidales bacterium]
MSSSGKRILVALDFPTLDKASALVQRLRSKTGFKAGMELCTAEGVPAVVEATGEDVFLDLKFDDIPNTIAGAVKAAARHHVKMLNVHCSGGPAMKAARQAADEVFVNTNGYRPLLIGVTVLTSHTRESLAAIGIDPNLSIEELVTKRAILAMESGLDGVVCSPQEIKAVRKAVCDEGFLIITPGIRGKDAPPDDQKRTMTAREAVDLGANYLVIGRPITNDPEPEAAADRFIEEIS